MQPSSRRLLKLVLALTGVLVYSSAPAFAQVATETNYVSDVVAGLQADAVFVHPDASSALSEGDAEQLRDKISNSNAGAVYIAVLPEAAKQQAGGSTTELLKQVVNGVRRNGTYALVVGTELRAGHTQIQGLVPDIATKAVQENSGGGTAAVLGGFVDGLAEAAQSEGGFAETDGGGGGGGSSAVPLAVLALGGGAAAFAISKKRKTQRLTEAKQLKEVKDVAEEDLVALGESLRELDLQVEMPSADPRAKQEYVKALGQYETATRDLDRAQRLQDIQRVSEDVAEGRYAITRAQARLEGIEPPEKRDPCFFDPRHGQSVTEVEWSGDGSMSPRQVPACAADAQMVRQGRTPEGREITVDGRRVPYWNAPAYYGPWAGGYYGGGGLLQGMLIGSMFGGGFGGGGFGYGGTGGNDGGDGGGSDGNDFGDFGGFGGGGFGGGGDFGGGGFGGGDFGGGDFGG